MNRTQSISGVVIACLGYLNMACSQSANSLPDDLFPKKGTYAITNVTAMGESPRWLRPMDLSSGEKLERWLRRDFLRYCQDQTVVIDTGKLHAQAKCSFEQVGLHMMPTSVTGIFGPRSLDVQLTSSIGGHQIAQAFHYRLLDEQPAT